MAEIITLGELLIDLTQNGTDGLGNGVFTAYPGGAPANVAVAASRLGAHTAFIGKVGNDRFGAALETVLKKEGVDTAGLYVDDSEATTLAIASIDDKGERSFSFYRSPGADTRLTAEEALSAIDKTAEDDKTILHVGSLSLTASPSREACTEAVKYAKSKGMLISYDPNYREALWDSGEEAVEQMKSLLPYTDILKVSEEEMEMLTGTSDLAEGSILLSNMGREAGADEIGLILVTAGKKGAFIRSGIMTEKVPGSKVKVADTNGAGDTFLGAMLMQIAAVMRKNMDGMVNTGWGELIEMVRFANRAAAITCSRHGAIPAMPSSDEV